MAMQLRKIVTDITSMILVFAPISLLAPVIQDNQPTIIQLDVDRVRPLMAEPSRQIRQ